jgi:predicted DNA binding CopG/RHH family protein
MKRISELKTEHAEVAFWEEHSIGDYWNDLEECRDTFKRPKLTPITLKFDPLVLKKIKMLARKRGLSHNAYIRYLLAKSVEKDIVG